MSQKKFEAERTGQVVLSGSAVIPGKASGGLIDKFLAPSGTETVSNP